MNQDWRKQLVEILPLQHATLEVHNILFEFIESEIQKAEERGRQEMKEEIIKWVEDNTYKINVDGGTKAFGRIRYNQALLELIHHLKNI